MKKILILVLFCLSLFIYLSGIKANAETYTTFESLDFDEEYKDIELLDSWSDFTLNGYLSKLKKKAFGWSTYYTIKKAHFSYVAETLYYVKNQGTEEIVHTFKYEESEEETIQKTVSGSLKTSTSYNKDSKKKETKFKFGLETQLKYEYKDTIKTKRTQTDSVKITVAPNSELYIKVKGEANLYQGVANKYVAWIKVKEGGFEYAIITTEYYSIEMNPLGGSSNEES